ncbi:hypothetical protein Goklo_018103, partial [Gossypium klotzschianum]|nr:hypothetical protein [Gossypium klotzschianum]
GLSKRVKVIVTYFLVVLGGNFSPSANDLKDILGSIIVEVDDDKLELLLLQVKGKYAIKIITSG